MLTIDGLITGIDTESIVQGLLEIQQTQIDRLNLRKQDLQSQKAAYDSLEAQLLSLQSVANRLGRAQNSVFTERSVNISDESALIVTAENDAAIGNYQVHIDALARAHQVASNGFEDADSAITEGTLAIRVGNGTEQTITIDSSNNTLQGLADAINLADAGVSASIVNDGTAGTPIRILLSANETGAANEITLTNNLTTGAGTQPAFDFGNPVQAATDAQVRLGDGAGALNVFSSTNSVDELLEGVTLDLLAADATKPIDIQVGRNTEVATEAITELVDSFNGLMDFIGELVRFNPETEEAGLLIGDRTVTDIQNEVRSLLQDVVPDVDSKANRLSVLGISISDQGRLIVNSGRLETVLSGGDEDISSRDLQRLFSLTGESSNANVEFLLGSSRTRPSVNPYQVDLTQAAEQAVVNGNLPLGNPTVITAANNSLSLIVDGQTLNVTLAGGTYMPTELTTLLEEAINTNSEANGRQVSVGIDVSGQLELRSDSYGTSSEVSILSGTALTDLGLSGLPTDVGVDVAGTFIVDGITETATGRGRILTGNPDNGNTADAQLLVSLTPAQIVAGPEAEITVTQGLGSRLSELISDLVDSEFGKIDTARDRFDQRLDTLDASITRQQEIFDQQQEDIISQFVALESAIAELQTTSSFLATQLAGVSGLAVGV